MMDYILIRKPIKNVYIRVKDGQVTVTAPRSVSKARIDAFVQQKQTWIERQMTRRPICPAGDVDWVKARMDR
jgi:predicted metal-dependent hydrolase